MPDYEDTVPVILELERAEAERLERAKAEDPDFVKNAIRYGLLRRGVFDILTSLSRTKALTS